MIVRSIVIAAVAGVAALQVPSIMKSVTAERGANEAGVAAGTASPMPASYSHSGRAEIPANRSGHFLTRLMINGRAIDGMIDTGATYVSINESTARRVGIAGSDIDFKYSINTANGQGRAARVVLKQVEIGNVRVRNVEAFVLEDRALSGTLIGMSFMKKLQSYAVEDGSLKLVQ